jgi:hypothetical protein
VPIQLAVDETSDVAVITCQGRITSKDLTKFFDSLTYLDVKPSQAVFDLSSAHLSLSTKTIHALASKKPVFRRLAIVATDQCVYGMSRMYELLLGGRQEVRVYRDRDQADCWLASRNGSDPK